VDLMNGGVGYRGRRIRRQSVLRECNYYYYYYYYYYHHHHHHHYYQSSFYLKMLVKIITMYGTYISGPGFFPSHVLPGCRRQPHTNCVQVTCSYPSACILQLPSSFSTTVLRFARLYVHLHSTCFPKPALISRRSRTPNSRC
jgi:hypothetical protein